MKNCPRCNELTLRSEEVENALSRRDNKTYICSGCGTEEAFLDAGLATYLEDEKGAVQRSLDFEQTLV